MLKCLLSMHKALNSIPSTLKKKDNRDTIIGIADIVRYEEQLGGNKLENLQQSGQILRKK